MYVLLGDPGYPGPPGLRGESGQKGMSVHIIIYYICMCVCVCMYVHNIILFVTGITNRDQPIMPA